MAKQESINEMKGTIGNLTFYKTKNGYKVRRKSSISKQTIMTSPRFLATRQNMAEFGNAGKAGKAFRNSIRPLLNSAKDSFMISRFLKVMRQIIATDTVNTRGNRIVAKGAITLLKGFNFNIESPLESNFTAPYVASINRGTGILKVDIPSFLPNTYLNAPAGATHFKIVTSSCEMDFQNQNGVTDNLETAPLACDNNLTAAISHVHNATAGSTLPLFLLMGIHFYQKVNGIYYPLKSQASNSLGVIEVDNS